MPNKLYLLALSFPLPILDIISYQLPAVLFPELGDPTLQLEGVVRTADERALRIVGDSWLRTHHHRVEGRVVGEAVYVDSVPSGSWNRTDVIWSLAIFRSKEAIALPQLPVPASHTLCARTLRNRCSFALCEPLILILSDFSTSCLHLLAHNSHRHLNLGQALAHCLLVAGRRCLPILHHGALRN